MREFIKHIALYFFPELKRKDNDHEAHGRIAPPDSKGDMVPIYNETGDAIIGYRRVEKSDTATVKPMAAVALSIKIPNKITKEAEQKIAVHAPIQKAEQNAALVEAFNPVTAPWDGWPNGTFDRDFTWAEVEESKDIMEHWAHQVRGGFRGGTLSNIALGDSKVCDSTLYSKRLTDRPGSPSVPEFPCLLSGATGDYFFKQLEKFHQEYPGLITDSNMDGGSVVISLQSPFMRSQLVRKERLPNPVNGMVNDAAHGWWKERNSLLMISSVYCDDLNRWLPGMISYMNGATIEHYTQHFFTFFQSVIQEAEESDVALNDALFVGVMDLSESERGGFLNAWMLIWTIFRDDPLGRTEEELYAAGEALLRACLRHFEEHVKRGLLKCGNSEEFLKRVAVIGREYSLTLPWLGWYRQPSHAQMLFESERRMDLDIWDSIPSTTNAEEAMHWTLYCGFGRKHEFFTGLRALARFIQHIEKEYRMVKTGGKTRYGKPEHHKKIYKYKGTTHPARVKMAQDNARRKTRRNDGRSYDTKMSLCQANAREAKQKQLKFKKATEKNKKAKKATPEEAQEYVPAPANPLVLPSFPWLQNSCWLDTALHILHIIFSGSAFSDLESICTNVDDNSGLRSILFTGLQRFSAYTSEISAEVLRKELGKHRTWVRRELKNQMVITDLTSSNTPMGWLVQLIQRDTSHDQSFRLASIFQAIMVEVHKCTGCEETAGMHVEITEKPRFKSRITLCATAHMQYGGRFEDYARDYFTLEKEPVVSRCWRVKSGQPLCTGQRTDVRNLVISIPVMFMIEVGSEENWDFPSRIVPEAGMHYSLVSLALCSNFKGHFRARYLSPDGKQVYEYDDMGNNACPMLLADATPETHFYGRDIDCTGDWKVSYAFYYLSGGSTTQESFYSTRLAAVSSQCMLKFTTTSLSTQPMILYADQELKQMPKSHRHWERDPYKVDTAEYLQRGAPSAPYRRVKVTPESEDSESVTESPPTKPQPLPDSPKTSPEPSRAVNSNAPEPTLETPVEVNCCCGMNSDENSGDGNEMGIVIQCDKCLDWMHAACQQGRADVQGKEKFVCGKCNMLLGKRRNAKRHTGLGKQPSERLHVGNAALVKDGIFWYPVRLIERLGPKTPPKKKQPMVNTQWRVKWWRGCRFNEDSNYAPDTMSIVPQAVITDCLWGNRTARRQIRLGKWDHACEAPTIEDILADPSSIPYTKDVDNALKPHAKLLYQLLVNPEQVDKQHVPAINWVEATRNTVRITKANAPMGWVETSKRNLSTAIFVNVGGLSVDERAQIANWIEVNICKSDRRIREHWLTKLPHAHANTLYIAHRSRAAGRQDVGDTTLLQESWKVLLTADEAGEGHADVDRESVVSLEEDMFEHSKRSGIAGNQQWGLDAGDHQDCWGVYSGLPQSWSPGDREEEDDELEYGPGFIKIKLPKVEKQIGNRPKPRPIIRDNDENK
ncbi:hypothetical protein D9619_008108 [Psilocybe cf. subviscida]|uniref:Zinc finger PHD-type domain-containing protein n=1 Tax=Psilocybe cf. subviscida TaxID=2480587 RepID=A0A8H5ESU3_9AGAR|nr:hypothetical protein D9619_008108 [Psilocybe cf. subviscida]